MSYAVSISLALDDYLPLYNMVATQRRFLRNDSISFYRKFKKNYTITITNKLFNNFYKQVIIIYCKNHKNISQ